MLPYRLSCALIALLLTLVPPSAQAQQSYTEDFTTTTYKDAVNNTADWNTADGELKLFPFEPTLVGTYDTPYEAHAVVVAGDLAFVADRSSGLHVIDISDLTNPTLAGSYNALDPAWAVEISAASPRLFCSPHSRI